MKAKRRHELRDNDLAHTLEELRRSFKDWGVYVIGAMAVVVVGTVIMSYMKAARNTAIDDSYSKLEQYSEVAPSNLRKTDEELLRSLDRIGKLGEKSNDPVFKVNALQRKAQIALEMAVTSEDGVDDSFLDVAKGAFEDIVREHKNRPLYYGRALYGLFQVEANAFANDGDTAHRDVAVGHLEKLRDDARLAGIAFQTMAIDRLNELDDVFTSVSFAKKPASAIQAVIQPGPTVPKDSGVPQDSGVPSATVTIGNPPKSDSGDSTAPDDSESGEAPEPSKAGTLENSAPENSAPAAETREDGGEAENIEVGGDTDTSP